MSGGHGHDGPNSADMLRKLAILVMLVLGYVALHTVAVPAEGFDPRGLLALGFVILAAYTVGELAEVVKLPHITGYLLAGLVLGPSTAHVLHDVAPGFYAQLPPPFDEGILNERVKHQLLLLDDLALALIALTAGGELRVEALRKGIRRILSVAAVQVVVLMASTIALVWAISGPIPVLALPQLGSVDTTGALALGAVVASISLATSPAATIAVINSSGAKGETTDTVLSVVVLKDVLVVICFSAATAVATGVLGLSAEEGGFLTSLGHIAWSIVVGTFLGGLVHLYLRFVGAELLLFLVGLIYSATFLCHQWHLEAALVFITAGFVTANFSDLGEVLIHEVERLSLPVYVVFFTLAGAKLHLDVLWAMAGFAVALVLVRMGALYVSTRAGAVLGGGGQALQRYGWMGFVSQAGLAITLATTLTHTYPGEVGQGLFSLVLGGVALNEMFGPVMLQWGLTAAGDTAGPVSEEAPAGETQPAEPTVKLPADLDDPWGEPLQSGCPAADEAVDDLETELKLLVRDLREGPLTRGEAESHDFLSKLRREFLKGHRRATVAVQTGELAAVARVFRTEVTHLGDGWRDQVLDRAARARSESWSPAEMVGVLDALVAAMPESVEGPIRPASLEAREEAWYRRLARLFLRLRVRAFGGRREINVRALSRYHFGGRAPARLEGVAALLINEEGRLAARTSQLFLDVSQAWERAADKVEAGEFEQEELLERLSGMRAELDEDFAAMEREVEGAYQECAHRAAFILGNLLRDLKEDVRTIGTVDLPHRRRRYSRVYAERNAGIRALTTDLAGARRMVAARLAAVALDLELVGLEGRVHGEVEQLAQQLERDMRGRGPTQLERVDHAVEEWLSAIREALEGGAKAGQLATLARTQAGKLHHVVDDARRTAQALRAELTGDDAVAPVLKLMLEAARSLTDWYTIPAEPVPEGDWTLPPERALVEVPFRELTVAWVESRVARELSNRTWSLAERSESMVEFLAELDRVIGFNVELAGSELEVLAEAADIPDEQRELVTEMLIGAIGRSQARLKRLQEEIAPWPEAGSEAIRGAVLDALNELRAEVMDGGAGALRSRLFGERRMGELLGRREEWRSVLSTGRKQTGQLVMRALGPDRVESLRQFLGLPAARQLGNELRDVLAEPEPGVDLPVVYRRLFSDRALEAGDLIVGREAELEALQRAVGPGAVLRSAAVIGLRGTGASSLASAVARGWSGTVRRIQPSGPVSVEDVAGWFAEHSSNTLTVLSGVRWLYSMEPGGLAPAQRLATELAKGRPGAWVITEDVEVWRALSALTSLDRAVGRVIQLDALSSEDLASAVMSRHQMSGYELDFDASDDFGWQLAHLLLRGREGEARQREAWFRTLHEACGGVMQDALRLWLASIREVDVANGVIRLGAVPRPPVARLFALDDAALLLLVQVTRQGWMDAQLHSRLFRLEPSESAVVLQSWCHAGLLVQRADQRFELARHLRTPVHRALRARGWTT